MELGKNLTAQVAPEINGIQIVGEDSDLLQQIPGCSQAWGPQSKGAVPVNVSLFIAGKPGPADIIVFKMGQTQLGFGDRWVGQ